jgi:hypothetical protein
MGAEGEEEQKGLAPNLHVAPTSFRRVLAPFEALRRWTGHRVDRKEERCFVSAVLQSLLFFCQIRVVAFLHVLAPVNVRQDSSKATTKLAKVGDRGDSRTPHGLFQAHTSILACGALFWERLKVVARRLGSPKSRDRPVAYHEAWSWRHHGDSQEWRLSALA